MDAGGDGAVTVLARGEGLAAWRQIATAWRPISSRAARGGQPVADGSRVGGPGRGQPAYRAPGARRARGARAGAGDARGAAPSWRTPRLAYPIGRRTRFSEIVSQAGREAWGDLLAAETVPADPADRRGLGPRASGSMLELLDDPSGRRTPLSTARTCLPLPRFEDSRRPTRRSARSPGPTRNSASRTTPACRPASPPARPPPTRPPASTSRPGGC